MSVVLTQPKNMCLLREHIPEESILSKKKIIYLKNKIQITILLCMKLSNSHTKILLERGNKLSNNPMNHLRVSNDI